MLQRSPHEFYPVDDRVTRFVPVDEVADDLENECHRVRSLPQHDRVL